MWRMCIYTLFLSMSFVNGQETIGACKDIAALVNGNNTKEQIIDFHGNITILAMLNASSDACIRTAEMINGLNNQLWDTKYFQMNFVILNSLSEDQIGDRQRSELLREAASNVTILSNQAHNITGLLKAERDYILVVNRCGRLIFHMIDPCNVTCSDLKTSIFTTFYDNIYRFCGDCQVPYAVPIDARIQQLNPDFYKNIDNCGVLNTTDNGSELFDLDENVHIATTTINKVSSVEDNSSAENNSQMNVIHRTSDKIDDEVAPIKIQLGLPNIHTINYKITKHSHAPSLNKSESSVKNIIIEEEINKSGKPRITVLKSFDDSPINTQYFDKKEFTKKNKNIVSDNKENKQGDIQKIGQQFEDSVEETINDNLIEFSDGTTIENSFNLTDQHAMYHIYHRMLPKLRKLLDQHKK